MAWRSITIADVRLSPQEKSGMQAIQGSTEIGAQILANVAAEFRAAIESVGGSLGNAGEVSDLVRLHVTNRTRWLWLCEFPALKSLQTEAREKLNTAAEKMLADITSRKVAVAGPDGNSAGKGGSWGSSPRIPMRTETAS